MRTLNYTPVQNADMGANISVVSTELTSLVLISFQCSWTGAPVGTLKLQASNTNPPQGNPPTTDDPSRIWSDVSGSTVAVNGAGNALYNLSDIGYLFIRVVYTRTSGTGALTIVANGKGV